VRVDCSKFDELIAQTQEVCAVSIIPRFRASRFSAAPMSLNGLNAPVKQFMMPSVMAGSTPVVLPAVS